jgi:hypothetical protein
MKFNGSERKILETLFGMSQGYVLDFSNRTMEEFFQEHFGIEIYNPKYDRENLSSSKANRLRTIWEDEDDLTVGKIIYALIEYMEISSMLNGKEISQTDLLLIPKVKDIAARLVSAPSPVSFQTETQAVLEKSKIIRDFTASQFNDFSLNKKIYLLNVLYSYYEAILRAYYGNGLIFLKSGIDELNVSFKVLRRKLVEVILSEPSFEELKESQCYQALIEPLTSLYSAPNFLDGVWSDGVEQYLIDFREMVADKDLFENNSEIHPFDKSVALLLGAIKEEVAGLESIMREKEKGFLHQFSSDKKTDAKKDDVTKPEETVIKHEHTHRFENSIQEKEIAISIDDKRNTSKTKNKFPYPIPAGTEWRQVSMKVLANEKIQIKIPAKEHTATYEEMGFGKHDGKPSVIWAFFKILAMQNGEISIADETAKVQYKKQKQQVSDILKNYFSMESDPFHPYKENNSYKTRFTLFSDTTTEKGKTYANNEKNQSDRYSDFGEYMEDIAPIL